MKKMSVLMLIGCMMFTNISQASSRGPNVKQTLVALVGILCAVADPMGVEAGSGYCKRIQVTSTLDNGLMGATCLEKVLNQGVCKSWTVEPNGCTQATSATSCNLRCDLVVNGDDICNVIRFRLDASGQGQSGVCFRAEDSPVGEGSGRSYWCSRYLPATDLGGTKCVKNTDSTFDCDGYCGTKESEYTCLHPRTLVKVLTSKPETTGNLRGIEQVEHPQTHLVPAGKLEEGSWVLSDINSEGKEIYSEAAFITHKGSRAVQYAALKTANGAVVRVTSSHYVPVVRDGKSFNVQAHEVELGDVIMTSLGFSEVTATQESFEDGFVHVVTPSGKIVQFDNEEAPGAVITTFSDINVNIYHFQMFRRWLQGPSNGEGPWERRALYALDLVGII